MNLLLDTHIWLWGQREPERLSLPMKAALRGPGEKFVSVVSIWETCLLAEKGRVVLPMNVEALVKRQAGDLRFLGVNLEVALEFGRVRLGHPDPADRLLVATARVHGLTLMTADRKLLEAPGVDCWQ